ncbi:serine protease [Streptosporangium sp. NPDC051022]|uniref:trypsin-like serine peptidase n=1 Tax=Streptosporangium sp. NPDC051022 TaxID=3155752 RepID=UPI00343A2107
MNSRARRLAIPLTGLLLIAGVIGATTPAEAHAAPGGVTGAAASTSAADAVAFWSPERMRGAGDVTEDLALTVRNGRTRDATAATAATTPDGPGGAVPPIGGEGAKTVKGKHINLPNTVGRIFFTLPGSNPLNPASWKYCSGSSVQGRYHNVVATAAHCVYDVRSNRFHDNWIFVPSYWDGDRAREGKNPYGVYAAAWFNAHDDFVVKEDYDFDYAFVNVHPGLKVSWSGGAGGTRRPSVRNVGRLGDNVGGQGLAWNQKVRNKVFSFGYPAGPYPDGDSPFTGRTMEWCYGTTGAMPAAPKYSVQEHTGLACPFTAGAGGGAWLLRYDGSTRTGYLNGVNGLNWDTDGNGRYDTVSSPYFNGDTYRVYRAAAGRRTG